MKHIALVFIFLFNTGCASYMLRKQCESINWFEHGQKVAMSGKRLNADSTVMECRRVEADIKESQLDQGFKSGMQKYCSPEQAYQTGKDGDFFARDLCDGPQISVYLNQHQKGVRDYCAKSNGQKAGSSGKKYQNICPKDLETAFLAEYRKGRKRYVKAMIENREDEARQLENKINMSRLQTSGLRSRLSLLQSEKNSLETQKTMIAATDSAQLSYVNHRLMTLDSDISMLRSNISQEDAEISRMERARDEKRNEISAFKAELPSLEQD